MSLTGTPYTDFAPRMFVLLRKVVVNSAAAVWKDAVDKAPQDTGFLKNSCYVAMKGKTPRHYDASVKAAPTAAPRAVGQKHYKMLPAQVETADLAAIVAFGAEYALAVEHREMTRPAPPGNMHWGPFLGPATLREKPKFAHDVKAAMNAAVKT